MRLARRFRPKVDTRLTRANTKKNAKRVAENLALLRKLSEKDAK